MRLGTYIKFIPYPVTMGFTAGIAVIIFASQLRELFGLRLPGEEPGEVLAKLAALGAFRQTSNPAWPAFAPSWSMTAKIVCRAHGALRTVKQPRDPAFLSPSTNSTDCER